MSIYKVTTTTSGFDAQKGAADIKTETINRGVTVNVRANSHSATQRVQWKSGFGSASGN